MKAGLATEPGDLTLGVAARGLLDGGDGFLASCGSREQISHLADTDGFGGTGLEIAEGGDFVGDAGVDHGHSAAVDAVVELIAVEGEDDAVNVERGIGERLAEGGLRLAGEEADFEGSLDVAGIGERDVVGGGGVEPEEFGDFVFKGLGLEAGAKGGIGLGELCESVSEGFDVKA